MARRAIRGPGTSVPGAMPWGDAAVERASRPQSFPEAVACALRGIGHAARTQRHFRSHLLIAVAALVAAIEAGLTATELGVLAATIGLVLAAELVNTAVEMLTDLVAPRPDARAAAVKDASAGAVLVASLCAAAVGAFLFLPHVAGAPSVLTRGVAAILAALFLAAFLGGAVRPAR